MDEIIKMNFDEAIVAHAEWKLKLTLYLQGDGNLDYHVVCKDNQCKLGKWIYSDGKRYENETAYEHLRKVHAHFHRQAGEVIKTIDEQRHEEAKKLIAADSEYVKVSTVVVEAIAAVKKRVEEKTNLIMENVNVGILVIDRKLEIQSGYSQHCHQLFDTDKVAGFHLCDILKLDKAAREHFAAVFEQVFEDFLPSECSLSMLPPRVRCGSRVLELYTSIVRSGGQDIDFVLFTIQDATKLEALEAENAENAALLKIMRNKDSFVNFLHDAKRSLDSLLNAGTSNQIESRRHIHTIKGNSGMFDMTHLMQHIGRIESHEFITKEDIASILSLVLEFVGKYKDLIGIALDSKSDEIHNIAESELAHFETAFGRVESIEQAHDFVREMASRLRMRPARSILGPIEERVTSLAQRLNKSVRCLVKGDAILVVPERWGPVMQVLSHILRNSIDHGIELPEERLSIGKPSEGLVEIEFSKNASGALELSIVDDGRGIDVDRLVVKAIEKGVIKSERAALLTHAEKVDLIFLDGVSTAAEVSDVSGRGVGMSALLASVKAAGGTLEVSTERNKGTKIRMAIPTKTNVPHLRKAS